MAARVAVEVLSDFLGTREERLEFGDRRHQLTIPALRANGSPNVIFVTPGRAAQLSANHIVRVLAADEAPADPGPPAPVTQGPAKSSVQIRREQLAQAPPAANLSGNLPDKSKLAPPPKPPEAPEAPPRGATKPGVVQGPPSAPPSAEKASSEGDDSSAAAEDGADRPKAQEGAGGADGEIKCTECDRTFKNEQGMLMHRRHAHKNVVDK